MAVIASVSKSTIRFQGQYYDHEKGLHYNRYRYYDPRAGRFVSKDPISYAGG
nr:RHS repeat-associated core domain-containing protein [Pseudomonas lundensis]